jgi:hypothetical protein
MPELVGGATLNALAFERIWIYLLLKLIEMGKEGLFERIEIHATYCPVGSKGVCLKEKVFEVFLCKGDPLTYHRFKKILFCYVTDTSKVHGSISLVRASVQVPELSPKCLHHARDKVYLTEPVIDIIKKSKIMSLTLSCTLFSCNYPKNSKRFALRSNCY